MAGDHCGLRSLSTSCARIPSTKSWDFAEADRHPELLLQNLFQGFQMGCAAHRR